MRNRLIFGILFVLLGAVWMGQGLGYVKGSFMTGERFWFWVGLGCAVLGAGLLATGVWGRRPAD